MAACGQSIGGFAFRLSLFSNGFRARVAPVAACPRPSTVSRLESLRFPAAGCLRLPVPRRRPSGRGPLRPPPALPVHPDLLLYLT